MKRLLPVSLLLATAIAVIATAPALAAPPAADQCASISRALSEKAGAFVRVNGNGRTTALAASARPADFYRSMDRHDAALQQIANAVWALRADMASRNCRQAAAFSY